MGKDKEVKNKKEKCPRGLRCKSRKFVGAQAPRGFESRLLRFLDALLGKGFRNKFGMTMLCLLECKMSVWCDVKIYIPIYTNGHPELVSGSDFI